MKELTVIEFSANDRLIAKESGEKDSYNVELEAYTNNGIPEGEIEITANEIDERTLDPRIKRALYENNRKRMTRSALMRKAEIVKEDDKIKEDYQII